MRITLLVNPRSGRGRAARIADAIDAALRARGHVTERITVGAEPDPDPGRLGETEAMVVVGGDGTVHHAAPRAVEARVPIYHAASGNENLFAREFSMSPAPERVLGALEHGTTRFVDQGVCNGAAFLIMGSVGPDASVIDRLSVTRRRPSGHSAYVRPVIAEARSPRIPRVTVRMDGREVLSATRAMVVVANSRQYALRIDPCRDADMGDGLLDVVALPCATAAGALRRLVQCRFRRQGSDRRVVGARGRSVHLELLEGEAHCQFDGEAPAPGSGTHQSRALEFTVLPGVLPVRVPPAR